MGWESSTTRLEKLLKKEIILMVLYRSDLNINLLVGSETEKIEVQNIRSIRIWQY